MRIVPNSDTVPPSVNGHLLPNEVYVISVRQHPGVLVPGAGTAAGAFLVAIAVSIVHSGPAAAKYIVWLLAVFLILRFLASVWRWYTSYIVITNHRFLLVSGKIAASPLADLKILVTGTSGFLGRLGRFGYGAFRIGPDGPNQLVIDYIPCLAELELVVNGLLYPDPDPDRSE